MIYFQLISISMLIVSSFAASTESVVSAPGGPVNCDNCPELRYTHHYTAKGCNPVYRSGCPNCVEQFDCPITQKDSTKCYYAGESYSVDSDLRVSNPCTICRCVNAGNNETDISCAHIECPEIFNRPLLTESNSNQSCYYSYKPGNCCGTKRCSRSGVGIGKSMVQSAPGVTCSYDGKVYKEGQQIELPDCYTCTCGADFDVANVKNSPACHQHVCYFNTKMLDNGCVPVYVHSGCCYSQFHCPPPNLEERRKHCRQPYYYGYCDQNVTRYHFDHDKNTCLPFTYSGCGGSVNTFESQSECLDYCTMADEHTAIKSSAGHCYYHGMLYPIGSQLPATQGYTCTCNIPPDFTCVLNN